MANRLDGWTNVVTGLGDAVRDKRLAAQLQGIFLRQSQAELIWRSSDLAARIIEKPPRDALRRGFEFVIKPNAGEEEERQHSEQVAIDGKKVPDWPIMDPPETEQRALGPPMNARFDRRRRDQAMVVDPTLATQNEDASGETKQQQERVMARMKALGAKMAVRQAAMYERAYGGAAIFLGTVDRSPGRSNNILARELDLKYLEELSFLTVLTPMEIVPYRYYGDPLAPNYGEVQMWTMVPKSRGISPRSSVIRVHESRLVLFKGTRTSRFMPELQRGFGDSVLNKIIEHIRNFDTSFDSAATLIHDFAQPVFKMKGLVELLQADDEGLIKKRAQAMDYVRSTLRAILLDTDEEFKREQTPVSGLPELLDRQAKRLAAAAQWPVTMLMGESPAGLNATGKADRDWYNEFVSSLREDSIIPALERIIDVELHATEGATKGKVPDGWSITMPPLEEPTELETADIRLKVAQADQIYANIGALHPEEIAESHWSGDEYSMEIKLNTEVREAALEVQQVQEERATDLHEQQMTQPPPGPPAPGKKPPPKR